MITHHITPDPIRTDCARDPLAAGQYSRDWRNVTCADCLARRASDPEVEPETHTEWAVHSKVHGSVERWKPCRDQEDAEDWAGSIVWGRDPGDWEIRPHVVSRTVTASPWTEVAP